jgi:hypothetical protein
MDLFANRHSSGKSSRTPHRHRTQSRSKISSASISNSSSKPRARSSAPHDQISTSSRACTKSSSTTTYDDTDHTTPASRSIPPHAADRDQLLLHIGAQFQNISPTNNFTVVSSNFGNWDYSMTIEATPMGRYCLQEVGKEPWNVVRIDGELSHVTEPETEDLEIDLEI